MAIRTKKIRLKKMDEEHYRPKGEHSRKTQGEVKGVKTNHVPPRREWAEQNKRMGTEHGRFLQKYDELEKWIDRFTTKDICFFFREVARENGVKYHLVFAKDCSIIKRLKDTYSNREICGMIEFLFTSGQTYLEVNRLTIGILGSRWVNRIYPDFKLWLDDQYVPDGEKSVRHEWKNGESTSAVGW